MIHAYMQIIRNKARAIAVHMKVVLPTYAALGARVHVSHTGHIVDDPSYLYVRNADAATCGVCTATVR